MVGTNGDFPKDLKHHMSVKRDSLGIRGDAIRPSAAASRISLGFLVFISANVSRRLDGCVSREFGMDHRRGHMLERVRIDRRRNTMSHQSLSLTVISNAILPRRSEMSCGVAVLARGWTAES